MLYKGLAIILTVSIQIFKDIKKINQAL